jgi:hypothetical protein
MNFALKILAFISATAVTGSGALLAAATHINLVRW